MRYIKIQFTFGLDCVAYQEIDDEGVLVRYLDEEGNTLEVTGVTESHVVEDDAVIAFTPEEYIAAVAIQETCSQSCSCPCRNP